MKGKINDPRFPPNKWKKCQHAHEYIDGTNTEIHYWENRLTGERCDFKFKDYD